MRRSFLVALMCLAVAAPAHANPEVIIAGPGSYLATFTTPVVVHVRGLDMTLAVVDAQPHNVIATDAVRPDGSAHWCMLYPSGSCPLFWSALIGLGETTAVEGLADTESGRVYSFYCDYHPAMTGKLIAV